MTAGMIEKRSRFCIHLSVIVAATEHEAEIKISRLSSNHRVLSNIQEILVLVVVNVDACVGLLHTPHL